MPRRSRGDQRGAVLPLIAIVSTVLVLMAAMAVDLGHQRVGRRDMQSLSDVVALDLSRQLDGRTAAQILASSAWTQARNESVARNDDTVGSTPVVTADLGQLDANGDFVSVSGSTVPTAVRVKAAGDVDFSFVPGRGGYSRDAVAALDSGACFSVGSFAARLGSDSSVNASFLRGLLAQIDSRLSTDLVSYQGLATASLGVMDLAAELGAGNVDALTSINKVTLGQFYLATGHALRNNGDVVNAQLLETLAAHVASSTQIDVAGEVGQSDPFLLSLAQGDTAAASSTVKVLDLVAGAAFLANGSNLLSVPNASVKLPQLGSLTTSLKVIEGPQIACGRRGSTTKDTDQVQLNIGGSLANVSLVTPSYPGPATSLSARVPTVTITGNVAKATATLTDILCGAPSAASPDGIDVTVASALANLSLTAPVKVQGNASVLGLGVVALDLSLDLSSSRSALPQSSTAQVRVTQANGYDTPATTGSTVSLPLVTSAGVSFTGTAKVGGVSVPNGLDNLLLAPLLSEIKTAVDSQVVTASLNPLVAEVNVDVLASISNFTGLTLGGADVYLTPRPNCDSPSLRG